jgi:hypothetical protein
VTSGCLNTQGNNEEINLGQALVSVERRNSENREIE